MATRGRHGIPCINCTGAQVTEVKCVGCGKTKDRDEFTKVQVRNAETAVRATLQWLPVSILIRPEM